jgi:hypothetical protein
MNTPVPYKFSQILYEYEFVTDNNILYSVKFTDGVFLLTGLSPHIPVFDVSIDVLELGKHSSPPQDLRAEATIVSIFRSFLAEHENSIVYVCDNLDNKQAARHRKFDMWFKRNKSTDIEKYDTYFIVEELEIYASMIVHSLNPFKEELIKVFIEQTNQYNK